MAIKIELINQALVMHDTVTGEILGESPKGLVYYNAERLRTQSVIEIVNIDVTSQVQQNWAAQPIDASVVDTADTPYTIASFQTFARTNLGF